jgi:Zn-dependent protease with chaperone function
MDESIQIRSQRNPYWRVGVLVFLAGGLAVSAFVGGKYYKADGVQFPACVMTSDFQSPLDQDLLKPFQDFEATDLSKKMDASILKPLLDDTRTINYTVSSVEITENQFPDRPEIHKIVQECAKILDIKKPRVFIFDGPGLNAFTTSFTDPVIILHASLLRRYVSARELRFIIGHEMGHIKCSHVKWHSAMNIARTTLPEQIAAVGLFPLLKWYRESEYSADNSGLICCQDLVTAELALIRLQLGLGESNIGRINIDEYLVQREKSNFGVLADGVQLWREVLSGHPFTPDRIKQLRGYAISDRYQAIWKR